MEVPKPCIYRVPRQIRDVKPEAYTPRMVLIGPLHRSLKSFDIAKDGAETSSDPWDLKKDYLKMEDLKKKYLESYTKKVGEDTIEEMRKTIQAEEKNIRASYEESTDWIKSEYFLDLILKDSVFIMEFITCHHENSEDDSDLDQSSYASVVTNDLILLENQLPYFIFRSLFSSRISMMTQMTFDRYILSFFDISIGKKTDFKHFTDMLRRGYEESLFHNFQESLLRHIYRVTITGPGIVDLKSADNLSQAGVKFKARIMERFLYGDKDSIVKLSLRVEFEKGVLTMPGFHASETSDMVLRNVIAFEQCHVALTPYTSNYIHFLNFLIISDRDVQLLTEEGVVTNPMGRPSLVVDMVNKLQDGVNVGTSSQYFDVAEKLRAHYTSRRKRCWATLKNVYFSDLWTGTATLAAVFLLLLTLIGTVASVIQAYKSF
ncbi:hypothetical protein V5N11_016980 [Cardamine amara subsp. amara]|uniref:Uncharacterized protein n=1 Tax=Cardamine amara subsp. amara TaxID=228776 RepID=A0ABD1BFJ8_CARAN